MLRQTDVVFVEERSLRGLAAFHVAKTWRKYHVSDVAGSCAVPSGGRRWPHTTRLEWSDVGRYFLLVRVGYHVTKMVISGLYCTVVTCHSTPCLHCLLSYVLMTLLGSCYCVHACAHLLHFNYHWLKNRNESDPFVGLHDISASELIFGMRGCIMIFKVRYR